MKRLLLLMGAVQWPVKSSCAFVSPLQKSTIYPVQHYERVPFPSPCTELYYRSGTEEDSSTSETIEKRRQGGRRRRRLFSVFSRRRRQSNKIKMQTVDTLEDVPRRLRAPPPPAPFVFNETQDNAAWVVHNMETFTPESTGLNDITGKKENVPRRTRTVRPAVRSAMARLTPPYTCKKMQMGSNSTVAVSVNNAMAHSTTRQVNPRKDASVGGPLLTRMTRNWFQNLLVERLHKWSETDPVNLEVRASPQGNVLSNFVMRGQYRSNVDILFDQVNFGNIRISGGGLIRAKRLVLNVWGFTPQVMFRKEGIYRFPTQFDFEARNCTLTQSDLLESSCIRNGLGRLLVRILRNAGVRTADVTVTSVDILPSNKISCSGEATTNFGSRVMFEVRSGISTSCRGHVLTFPGLEVTLQPALGVFMPVVPDISLDIGHNARLKSISINGKTQQASLDASVSITPQHTQKLTKYIQSKDAYLAQFFFDVGQWLTDIGNFTK